MISNDKSLVSILSKETNNAPFSIRFNLNCADRVGNLKARVVAGLTIRLMGLIQKGAMNKKAKKLSCRLLNMIDNTGEFDVVVHTLESQNEFKGGAN